MASPIESTASSIDYEIGTRGATDIPAGDVTKLGTTGRSISSPSGATAVPEAFTWEIAPQENEEVAVTAESRARTWVGFSREASRRLAELITEEEHRDLLSKHFSLTQKRFKDRLTRSEELDLQLIRWNLDRIEDAKFGYGLDFLERLVIAQEYLAENISTTLTQLERASS